jgi:hypothetical protein
MTSSAHQTTATPSKYTTPDAPSAPTSYAGAVYIADLYFHKHTPHYVSTSVVTFKDIFHYICRYNSTLTSNINLLYFV